MKKHPWSDPETIAKLSKEPIGETLASQVEEMLYNDRSLVNHTSDYSGYGLDHDGSHYRLFTSVDGTVDKVVGTWKNHDEFVELFSRQSDFSMSGADEKEPLFYTEDSFLLNNQTLTKATLEKISNFSYSSDQVTIFDFFIRHLPTKKQDELRLELLNLDSSFERAISTTLSRTEQKVIYDFATNYQGKSKDKTICAQLNKLSLTQGIEAEFKWEGPGSQYTIVRAYNDFLVALGYRFVYWVEAGLYDFAGFIVKEDELDEVMAFAKSNNLVFQPILGSAALPAWFKVESGKVDLKQLLEQEAIVAKELGRDFFLYLGMEGCRPCEVLENSIVEPDLSAAFENTYIVKIDVLKYLSELRKNFLQVTSAPVFAYITPEGRITNLSITGDAWEEDTIENISTALKPFFQKTNQAVPLAKSLSQDEAGDRISLCFDSSNDDHIKWMIEESEYDLSSTDRTFLHQVGNINNPIEFIDYVISKGGNVDAKSPAGYTALHNSILAEKQAITEKFLACGADINAQTNDGKSILFLVLDEFWNDDWAHHANIPHDKDKLQTLVNYCISLGADLTLKDIQGHTALTYAESLKQTEAYQLEVLKPLAG